MDRSEALVLGVVAVYAFILGAWVGRWALRKSTAFDRLEGEVRELRWRQAGGVPPAPVIAGMSVEPGTVIGRVPRRRAAKVGA
jgi:hypothetical protein